MSRVNVKNSCRCFLRSGMIESQEFTSDDEAKEVAEQMVKKMEDEFCKKHEFIIVKKFDDFNILIRPR